MDETSQQNRGASSPERYQEYDQALQAYLQAVQGDYLPAYNNLARLYLRDGDYERAAPLLRFALADPSLAQHQTPIWRRRPARGQ